MEAASANPAKQEKGRSNRPRESGIKEPEVAGDKKKGSPPKERLGKRSRHRHGSRPLCSAGPSNRAVPPVVEYEERYVPGPKDFQNCRPHLSSMLDGYPPMTDPDAYLPPQEELVPDFDPLYDFAVQIVYLIGLRLIICSE